MNHTSTDPPPRELTREERAAIRKLVLEECANYDGSYRTCALYDDRCFMLYKWWTGCFCRYFLKTGLPLNPELEFTLTGTRSGWKFCEVCGGAFVSVGSQVYCSEACRQKGLRRKDARRRRMYRKNKGSRVPN